MKHLISGCPPDFCFTFQLAKVLHTTRDEMGNKSNETHTVSHIVEELWRVIIYDNRPSWKILGSLKIKIVIYAICSVSFLECILIPEKIKEEIIHLHV